MPPTSRTLTNRRAARQRTALGFDSADGLRHAQLPCGVAGSSCCSSTLEPPHQPWPHRSPHGCLLRLSTNRQRALLGLPLWALGRCCNSPLRLSRLDPEQPPSRLQTTVRQIGSQNSWRSFLPNHGDPSHKEQLIPLSRYTTIRRALPHVKARHHIRLSCGCPCLSRYSTAFRISHDPSFDIW